MQAACGRYDVTEQHDQILGLQMPREEQWQRKYLRAEHILKVIMAWDEERLKERMGVDWGERQLRNNIFRNQTLNYYLFNWFGLDCGMQLDNEEQ